ncbi:MAG: hypothetical protein ACTS78_04230 [Arsenophonus sp. NC-WZS1-MAG3]
MSAQHQCFWLRIADVLVLILKGIQLKVKAKFFLGAQVSRGGVVTLLIKLFMLY